MRRLGATVAGMFAGLLAGVVLTEPVARLWVVGDGGLTPAVAVVLGAGPPVLAALGAAAGLVAERRTRRRAG